MIQADAVSWLQGPATRSIWSFWTHRFVASCCPRCAGCSEQRGWLASDALIYLERGKRDGRSDAARQLETTQDKQAGQVCYQLYLRDTKHDAAV